MRKSARRLQTVSLTLGVVVLFSWLLLSLIQGDLHQEWETPLQWGGPTLMLVASFAVFVLARTRHMAARQIELVGLSYEVVVAWGMPVTLFYGTFRAIPERLISFDLVGHSPVVLWVVFFSVLVPARPSRALAATIASVAAVPGTYALLVALGDAPALGTRRFIDTFVTPYAIAVLFAYVAARITHGMGRAIRRAQEVGSYRLRDRIGKGGMGEVWRGHHQLLARPAAVKLIRRDALGTEGHDRETRIARFEQEAQVTASLQSPHTVQLFDFGIAEDGSLYYVMELLSGFDLDSLVRRFGPLPAERVVHVLRQACHSLHEAHQRELVHRDIKPANIFLGQNAQDFDFVKVLDFGLVKAHTSLDGASEGELSMVGAIVGTPAYLAPEVALGTSVDGRADLYALGCVGYWLLTGVDVFEADSPMAMLVAHVDQEPRPPSERTEAAIPDDLERLILKCLAKDPADRPPSADALARALDALTLSTPWSNECAARWWARHRPATTGG